MIPPRRPASRIQAALDAIRGLLAALLAWTDEKPSPGGTGGAVG